MSAPITLQLQPARPHVQVCREPQLVYVLLSARIAAPVPRRTALNVCLVLDRSSSMRGERLFQVKQAARQVIEQLDRDDVFGLVAFNDRAKVVVPSQFVTEPESLLTDVAYLEASGGTEMAQGLTQAFIEVERAKINGINRLIVLTDGRTYGDDQTCIELARRAQERSIGLTALGIGTEWNEDLLQAMTAGPNSHTLYITSTKEIVNVFTAELHRLRQTAAQHVEIAIQTLPDTQIRSLYRVQPFLAALAPHGSDGQWQVNIGEWAASEDQCFLIELIVPPVQQGTLPIARVAVQYALAGTPTRQVATAALELPSVATVASTIEPVVQHALERVVAYQLQSQAWQAVADGQIEEASRRLKLAGTHLFNVGEAALAHTLHTEATQLLRGGVASADGQKRIKLGTRGLVAGS